jgi:hypothetical protein
MSDKKKKREKKRQGKGSVRRGVFIFLVYWNEFIICGTRDIHCVT